MYDKGLNFMAIAVIDRRCVFLLFCAGAAHVMDLPRAALCCSSLFLSVNIDIVIRFCICELTCAGHSLICLGGRDCWQDMYVYESY